MKRILITVISYSLLIISYSAAAQEQVLTLQKAYDLALQNYPLIKQRELIKQTSEYTVENLGKGFLPQININGQATYQSAVTEVKLPAPGIFIEPLSKDQYKLIADVNQLLYD